MSKLTAATGGLRKEKNDLAGKVGLLTKELADAKQAAATAEQEMKKVQAELQEKQKENKVELPIVLQCWGVAPCFWASPGSGSISQEVWIRLQIWLLPFSLKGKHKSPVLC